MNIKMVLFLLVCTRKAALTTYWQRLTASWCIRIWRRSFPVCWIFLQSLGLCIIRKCSILVICATCFCAVVWPLVKFWYMWSPQTRQSTTMRRWYQGFWLFRWREKSWELCTLSMILCLMWCRAMKPDYFMDRITSMKRCWVCGLRLVHFPSSSQTHWQPKYCTPLCVITLVTPRIKKYLTSTAVLELLPSFLLLLRKRLSAWKLLRKLWKLQK